MFRKSLFLLLTLSCSKMSDTVPQLPNGDKIVSVNGVPVKTKEEMRAVQQEAFKKAADSTTPQYMTLEVMAADGSTKERKLPIPRRPRPPANPVAPAAPGNSQSSSQ